MIYDLYDKLKSATRGYGTMDYEVIGYKAADLVPARRPRGNGANGWTPSRSWPTGTSPTAAASEARQEAQRPRSTATSSRSRSRPRSAARSIARESISALRKNVTAKCYGGDISRKRKLLEKQKEGKKRMKQVGNVEISQEAFLSVLDDGDE